MAMCRYCNKKGLFLSLSVNGMCNDCDKIHVQNILNLGETVIRYEELLSTTTRLLEKNEIIEKLSAELDKMLVYEQKEIPTIEPRPSELLRDLEKYKLELKKRNVEGNESSPTMENQKTDASFDYDLYCNGVTKIKGMFVYQSKKNTFIQNNKKNYSSEPNCVRYALIEVQFVDNQHGYYREYYKSGKLRREVPFVKIAGTNDLYAHGKETLYYEGEDSEGVLTYTIWQENEFNKMKRTGVWKLYSTDGGLLSEDFYDDVVLSEDGLYGLKQKEYHNSNGVLAFINEKDFGKSYYESGILKAEWKNNEFRHEGQYIEYYENDAVKMEVTYERGKRVGIMNKYFQEGQLQEKWSYNKDGKRIFVNKYYNNGQLKSEWNYVDGELVRKLTYDKNGSLK